MKYNKPTREFDLTPPPADQLDELQGQINELCEQNLDIERALFVVNDKMDRAIALINQLLKRN